MPTARELLEQADALMRRNRGGDTGIPVLTDVIPDESAMPSRAGPSTRERTGSDIDALAINDDAERDLEPPLLTDVVEEIAIDLAPLSPAMTEGDPSIWLGPDTIDPALHSITGPAPDTVGIVPPVTFRIVEPQAEAAQGDEERDPTVTRTLRAAGSAPTPPPTGSTPPDRTEIPPASPLELVPAEVTNDEERWRALAEQISMQVLQRLDLFIDTGLKTKLASHLQPIVARASAELVETINVHVGQLVQTYIAEAIEREIAQWRKQQK